MIQTRQVGLSRVFTLLFFAILAFSSPAAAGSCAGEAVVQAAARSFQKAAQSGSGAAFSAALARHAPVASLALQALGPYRAKLPAARRAEFQRNALSFMGKFVARNASGLKGVKLQVTACRGNIVESSAGGRKVIWRLSGSSVVDVKISGFSLTGQMRQKFVKVITQNGGDVGKLIDFLGRQ